ncbi:uncharacterized protein PHALS_13578 [Plasmopara halstedii]|uniref:Ubiquitin-like domain-containing protein n=1 Tax=Plasmopara halstedii TaxID=4781 RepID=A0A0P1AR44_PLAHL|nr:uncharacterized protein PHALS_13578 [Plasmopara halstedii]CEG43380.1 hypothetical protein PHALS_13578 [Plasmopara halstedii]|eukprot:XP_024579749.1 hypothetical protein PHALS_13578 [Plasmopara halstedii]
MSDETKVVVTVIFGKQSATFSVPAQDPSAFDLLKRNIYESFDVESKFQRLVLRGRDVMSATCLTDGCKLLLLRNRAYYEQTLSSEQYQHANSLDSEQVPSSAIKSSSKVSSKALDIDVNDLKDDVLLVQLFRGKARYDLIFPTCETILGVKKKLSAVLGLTSPHSLRLVIKGKTPKDDTVLDTLKDNKKLIKAMVLLQAQQHVMQEKEEDFRELLNDLAGLQAALQKVQKQIARNFMSKDESLFELSRLLDEGQRIGNNLKLIKLHLTGAKPSGPRVSDETLTAVTQAINETNMLTEMAQHLLEIHSLS